MPDKTLRVPVNESTVTAVRSSASDAGWTFVYAPGAGSNIHDPFGAYAARWLGTRGVTTVRFQFPYMESGRRSPDRPGVLECTWQAVVDAVRDSKTRLVVGGRSMGGRIGSMAVAAGMPADALALFAYPLHPPGKPDQLRAEHFAGIKCPALFVSGTADAFAAPDELRDAIKQLRKAKLHLLERADHGFAVPKSSGRKKEQVWDEALAAFALFLNLGSA